MLAVQPADTRSVALLHYMYIYPLFSERRTGPEHVDGDVTVAGDRFNFTTALLLNALSTHRQSASPGRRTYRNAT